MKKRSDSSRPIPGNPHSLSNSTSEKTLRRHATLPRPTEQRPAEPPTGDQWEEGPGLTRRKRWLLRQNYRYPEWGWKALCHGLVVTTGLGGVEGVLEDGSDVLRSSEPEGLPGPVETLDVFGIRPSG